MFSIRSSLVYFFIFTVVASAVAYMLVMRAYAGIETHTEYALDSLEI